MGPFVARKPRNTPEHAKRLDGPRRLRLAHVGRLPAELIKQLGDDSPRPLIIPANEHGWPPAGKLRVDHAGIAHRIERLHEMSLRELSLESLP